MNLDEIINLLIGENFDLYKIIFLSLKVSLSSVLIATLFALPIGAFLVVYNFPGKNIFIVFINTLMGLPPVVIGLMVYLLLSRAGPLGNLGVLFTPEAMIIAQTILIFPIITALARQIIYDLWEDYREQLTSLGASNWDAIFTLIWDTRYSLSTAILAGLGRALSEVGAVIIVGGNIEGVTRVMTTAIALETSKGELSLAITLGIVLIIIIFIINAIIYTIKEFAER